MDFAYVCTIFFLEVCNCSNNVVFCFVWFCFYIVYAGNENLHTLTKDGNNQLRVDLQDWEDIKKYALYNIFNVGDETTKYQLSVGDYSGDAGKYKCHSFIYEGKEGNSWSWSYGSWIYIYLCNQCILPLTL